MAAAGDALDPLTQAMPVPDLAFGGGVLLAVIMVHAIGIRGITTVVLRRSAAVQASASMWRAEFGFALTVAALLALHLGEVLLWSAALTAGQIIDGWAQAAHFAANCYTALGEPFAVADRWRMLPPIIAISGIFTFAWTASVLVDFVARYNRVRAEILARRD